MSDKPLSVGEIMRLVRVYGVAMEDGLYVVAATKHVQIHEEMERLAAAAADDDPFPCCSHRGAGDSS